MNIVKDVHLLQFTDIRSLTKEWPQMILLREVDLCATNIKINGRGKHKTVWSGLEFPSLLYVFCYSNDQFNWLLSTLTIAWWTMSVVFDFLIIFFLLWYCIYTCFSFFSDFNSTNCVSPDAMWLWDWKHGHSWLFCNWLHTLLTDLCMDQKWGCLDKLHSVPSSTERQRLYGNQSNPSAKTGLGSKTDYPMCRDTCSGKSTSRYVPKARWDLWWLYINTFLVVHLKSSKMWRFSNEIY